MYLTYVCLSSPPGTIRVENALHNSDRTSEPWVEDCGIDPGRDWIDHCVKPTRIYAILSYAMLSYGVINLISSHIIVMEQVTKELFDLVRRGEERRGCGP
jgi:hypothetical protein